MDMAELAKLVQGFVGESLAVTPHLQKPADSGLQEAVKSSKPRKGYDFLPYDPNCMTPTNFKGFLLKGHYRELICPPD